MITNATGDRESSAVRAFQNGLLGVAYHNTCAVLTTAKVRCWGTGTFGRTGYNSTANVGDGIGPSIVTAGDVPIGGDVVAVSGGGAHSCALLTTGKVRCWGRGDDGQLGHNSFANVGDGVGPSIMAAGDVPIGGDAVAITAGGAHTCALLTTGKVRCWGHGSSGELGHGSTANIGDGTGQSITTAGDVPIGGDTIAIAAGFSHTCALLTTGKVRCWGLGTFGRLGYNGTANVGDGVGQSIMTAGDVPIGADAVAVSAANGNTCA
ncbi:MAG: hypothetical protein QOJ25_1611, partial [Solirubrobacteraceae bacterium]|nr:hypothetical protein [Solirubrobacteraceae bacterium]